MHHNNIKKLIDANKWDDIYTLVKKNNFDQNTLLVNDNLISHFAAIHNNKKLIKYFIKNNPDIMKKSNGEGNSPIHLLATYGYIKSLELVLKHDPTCSNLVNDDGNTVFHILYDSDEFMTWVTQNNFNPESVLRKNTSGLSILYLYIANSNNIHDTHYNIFEKILGKYSKYISDKKIPLISLACEYNKPHITKLLLNYKLDPNQKDDMYLTPFVHCILNKNMDMCEYLVKHHDININYAGPEGDHNPLVYSIMSKNIKLFDLLLDHNFDVNIYNRNRKTALHFGLDKNIKLSSSSILKLLHLGDLNISNINNITPLHLLCKYHNPNYYSVALKEKKLDIFAMDNFNKRPIDYINGNMLYSFLDIAIGGYFEGLNLNSCKKNKDSKKCKDILKQYIFETGRSIPSSSDLKVIQSKINLIQNQQVNHALFNSDPFHNVIYTLAILHKYPHVGIPFRYYFYDKYMNELTKLQNTNMYTSSISKIIYDLNYVYTKYFFELEPYLIIWHNSSVNYINPNLKLYTQKCLDATTLAFIVFKLTLVPNKNSTHANILIYDKEKKNS